MLTQAPPAANPPTPKQAELIRALASRLFRYLLFGGGTGGGKSYLGAKIFINLAMTQPDTAYGIFRKNMVTLKRTTFKTFQKYARKNNIIEGRDYVFNKSEMTWTFVKTRAVIYFMELDITKDPEMNKLGGLELTAAMIDEADEVAEAAFNVLRFRIGRANFNGELAFIYLTCNPNQSWVRYTFYDPAQKNQLEAPFYFLESLITDNTYQSEQALAAASDPTAPAQYVERYFRGNWEYINDPNALFPNRVIDQMLVDHLPKSGRRTVGVDVSREGDDKTVFSLHIGDTLADLFEPEVDRGEDAAISDLVADELILYLKKNNVGYQDVWIDAVGNGGGVVDSMRRRGYYVNSFKSGEKTTDLHEDGTPKYDMLRSERYYKMAQAGARGTFKIWKECPELGELRKDLLAHTYETTDKQTLVESKKKMKKRLGRSPDFSDAVVMGWREAVPEGANEISTGGSWDDLYKDSDEDF